MFSRNAKSVPVGDARLDRHADIQDVTDVVDISDPTDVANIAVIDVPESTGAGIFLSAKPVTAAPEAKPGLRARFLRKPDVDKSADMPVDAGSPVAASAKWSPFGKSKAAPASTESASAASPGAADASPKTSKFKWSKAKTSPGVADAASPAEPAPVDTRPIGPTDKVKKALIVRKVAEKRKNTAELPIRVLIGFLPEVSERDARDYALGVAERNCDQISIVRFDAFKLNNGFAYEIQEGGTGRAYLPEIIKHFQAMGPFEKAAETSNVFIRTATRTVQVDRTRDGLQAFLLPESATEAATDWLEGTSKMTPAIATMFGMLAFGAVLFTTGFFALTLAMYARLQPYDAPLVPTVERATDAYNASPLSRWTTLQGVSGGEYVKAIRFANGKWELERGTAPVEPAAEPAPAAPAPAATPTPSN